MPTWSVKLIGVSLAVLLSNDCGDAFVGSFRRCYLGWSCVVSEGIVSVIPPICFAAKFDVACVVIAFSYLYSGESCNSSSSDESWNFSPSKSSSFSNGGVFSAATA